MPLAPTIGSPLGGQRPGLGQKQVEMCAEICGGGASWALVDQTDRQVRNEGGSTVHHEDNWNLSAFGAAAFQRYVTGLNARITCNDRALSMSVTSVFHLASELST